MKKYILTIILTILIFFSNKGIAFAEISQADISKSNQYKDLGMQSINNKEYNKAEDYLDKAISQNPNNFDAYVIRAICKSNFLKDDKGAILDFDKAIQLNPKFEKIHDLYRFRGESKFTLKDFKGALADYNKAIQLKPSSSEAYYDRGYCKKTIGDYQGALTDYNKAIQLNPSSNAAYYDRGYCKEIIGDYQGALSDYDKAIQLNANYEIAYYFRGHLKGELKDYKGAIADYDKVIILNPNNISAYMYRGVAKGALNDYQAAMQDLNKAKNMAADTDTELYLHILEIIKSVENDMQD